MANWLLWTDPHFTDNEIEAYRWNIFPIIRSTIEKYQITHVICLGDLTDRKDKFSSVLVNKLIEEFSYTQAYYGVFMAVLSGNHDKPVNGPYYWKFLDKLGIHYITQPEQLASGVWLLPFTSRAKEEWKDLNLELAKAIMMHQTGQGATVEGGRELTSHALPALPKGVPVFSGDVHRGQTVNGITYIGVPHPVKFSETWGNRILVIKDDDFKNPIDIPLNYTKRAILDIKNSNELEKLDFKADDQVRIRYALNPTELTNWPAEQEKIKKWAEEKQLYIASIEAVLIGDGVNVSSTEQQRALETMKPEEIVAEFSLSEKLDNLTSVMGIELIKSV